MSNLFIENMLMLSQRTILQKLVELYGDTDNDININTLEQKFLKRPNIHLNNNNKIENKEPVVRRKRGRPPKNKEQVKKVLKIVTN